MFTKKKADQLIKFGRIIHPKKMNYSSVKRLLKNSEKLAHDGLGLFLRKKTWI